MIYPTAYDTTACSGFVLKKTIDALQAANIHGFLKTVPGSGVRLVEGGSPTVDVIPAFAHPVVFTDSNKEECLALDVRPFGSWSQQRAEFVVRNDIEQEIAVRRALLNEIWLKARPQTLRDLSHVPMAVYSSWISEAVSRRFALDPREQFELAILAAIFYSSLFIADSDLQERDKLRVTNAVCRATRAKAEDVLRILDELEASNNAVIGSVAHFCALAPEVTKSVRLKDLNAGVLFAVLGGTWFGTNAKEMVAVALEHPPTWLALLIAAYSERTFKQSGLAKTAERIGGRNGSDDFLRAVRNVISLSTGPQVEIAGS